MAGELFLFPIPDAWEQITLGEIVRRGDGTIQTGPFGSQLHASDYKPAGVPFVMPINIGDNQITEDGIARISEADAIRLSRYRIQEGDIIYSRRGDVERRALARTKHEGWICGSGCLMVRVGTGIVDPEYASYYLGHPIVREWIVRHAVGATMPNLNTSIMAALPFLLPPLPEQRAIAQILGALDDKIELNRRMNATLEGMARALFQSWFVDFDPARAKLRGEQPAGLAPEIAALFPNALVETELGAAPEGWEVGTLGSVARQVPRTVRPDQLDPSTPYIGLEHMPKQSIALSLWGFAEGIASNKSEFRTGEFLFGKLRPYFHKVGIAPCDGVCSTDIVVVVPESTSWFGFVLGHISGNAFVEYTNAHSTGTKMPRTNWADMARYPIIVPSVAIACAYTNQIKPICDRIIANIHEAAALAALRDALLPRLISGQLRVADAERIAGRSS
jgi:type I restriction enzyme S subunit